MIKDYKFNNMLEMFNYAITNYKNKEYIFFNDTVYTYSQAYDRINFIANVLIENGIRKGDRVFLLLTNSPEYIFSYFAVLSIGAIAVPTNFFLKEYEIAFNMNDCNGAYIISSKKFVHILSGLNRRVPYLEKIFSFDKLDIPSIHISFSKIIPNSIDAPSVRIDMNDIAALVYTSGTTGKPKGVMLTHKNLLVNAASFSKLLKGKPTDRYVALLPLFHSYSFLVNVVGTLYNSSSVIILSSVEELQKEKFKEILKKLRPNIFTAVPQVYSALAKRKLTFFQRLLMPIKYFVSGGSTLPEATVLDFKNSYGKPIIEGYGLTEASPLVTLNPFSQQKIGTVGVAVPEVEIKVISPDGKELPPNTAGELCCRGENIMKGYWNRPEDTEKTIKNGWLHTGDLATIDEKGFVTIVGRIKDMIITKGINVYPREIEELLYLHEGIEIAAVVGAQKKDGDEIIVAFIKANKGVTLDAKELKAYVKKNLADYKVPKYFVILDEIPVNATGKVLKKDLALLANKMFIDKDK